MAEKSNKIFTVPNLLSFLRIVCVPFFAYYFYNGEYLYACGILALSGLSDLFDGKIARAFNQVSELGKVLDPIADKLTEMTLAVLFFITFKNSANRLYNSFLCWVFLFFVAKEILMLLIGAVLLLCKYKPIAAEIYGKLATFCFYFIMIAIMAFGPEIGIVPLNVHQLSWMEIPQWVTVALVITSALLTLVALLSYIPPVIRQINERKNNISGEVKEPEIKEEFSVNTDVEIAQDVETDFKVSENIEPEVQPEITVNQEPRESEFQQGFSVTVEDEPEEVKPGFSVTVEAQPEEAEAPVTVEEKQEETEIQIATEEEFEEAELNSFLNLDIDSVIDDIMDEIINNKQ